MHCNNPSNSEACRALDVFLVSFLTSWTFLAWSNFSRSATPGNFSNVPCLLYWWIMSLSLCGPVESQSPRNGFVTIFRLIHVDYFVICSFRLWVMCCFLRPPCLVSQINVFYYRDLMVSTFFTQVWGALDKRL